MGVVITRRFTWIHRHILRKDSLLEKFLKDLFQLFVVPLLLLAAGVGFLLLVFDEENVLLLKYKHPRITQCQR